MISGPHQLAPLSGAYPLAGMLSYPDRPVRYVSPWVRSPLCPPSTTLTYLLTNLYPGGTTQ